MMDALVLLIGWFLTPSLCFSCRQECSMAGYTSRDTCKREGAVWNGEKE